MKKILLLCISCTIGLTSITLASSTPNTTSTETPRNRAEKLIGTYYTYLYNANYTGAAAISNNSVRSLQNTYKDTQSIAPIFIHELSTVNTYGMYVQLHEVSGKHSSYYVTKKIENGKVKNRSSKKLVATTATGNAVFYTDSNIGIVSVSQKNATGIVDTSCINLGNSKRSAAYTQKVKKLYDRAIPMTEIVLRWKGTSLTHEFEMLAEILGAGENFGLDTPYYVIPNLMGYTSIESIANDISCNDLASWEAIAVNKSYILMSHIEGGNYTSIGGGVREILDPVVKLQ